MAGLRAAWPFLALPGAPVAGGLRLLPRDDRLVGLAAGRGPVRINQTLPADFSPEKLPPVAIIMPIFNEDVSRVFLGLRIMYESLEATATAANSISLF